MKFAAHEPEALPISVLGRNGSIRQVIFTIHQKAGERGRAHVTVADEDRNYQITARDTFEAFLDYRRIVEKKGDTVLCAGARVDVWPSGMSRSMGGGRMAYVMQIGKQATETVDIFAYAPAEMIAPVQEQEEYFARWKKFFTG